MRGNIEGPQSTVPEEQVFPKWASRSGSRVDLCKTNGPRRYVRLSMYRHEMTTFFALLLFMVP